MPFGRLLHLRMLLPWSSCRRRARATRQWTRARSARALGGKNQTKSKSTCERVCCHKVTCGAFFPFPTPCLVMDAACHGAAACNTCGEGCRGSEQVNWAQWRHLHNGGAHLCGLNPKCGIPFLFIFVCKCLFNHVLRSSSGGGRAGRREREKRSLFVAGERLLTWSQRCVAVME